MQPPPNPTAAAAKGWRLTLMVLAAVAVFFLAPPALRWLNPSAGSFDTGTLNAPVLAALQFFAAVSMAYVAWRFLFPRLYAYVADCMEEKLLANITDKLNEELPSYDTASLTDGTAIQLAAERRRIAQLQFLIRCVRLLFCLLPFFVFLLVALRAVNTALSVVPH